MRSVMPKSYSITSPWRPRCVFDCRGFVVLPVVVCAAIVYGVARPAALGVG
jgi:hypothetical protein